MRKVYVMAGAIGVAVALIGAVGLMLPQDGTETTSPGTQSSDAGQIAAAASAGASGPSYEDARWDPIHFKPAIKTATDAQCLACHDEVLAPSVREQSPAGVKSASALAWYQTLDTYDGAQDTFHRRHRETDYAKAVMDLNCNFCHQGNDPREEAPANGTQADGTYTLRKMVDPEKTCLMCHGTFPTEFMAGVEAPWPELRVDLEDEETKNGCLTCHGEMFRTVRHQVTYLKPDNIEALAAESSDVCFGCHGGRSWYRISYPYPRHPWPDMADYVDEEPEWAASRPTESDERYRRVIAPIAPAGDTNQ